VNHLARFVTFLVFSASAALGTSVGDTYEQVVAARGNPASQIVAGSIRVLTYPDAVIRLKDNLVVSVRPVSAEPGKGPGPAQAPTPPLSPAAQIASLRRQLDDAVKRVQAIVNQEVPPLPRDPGMRLWEYYFHDGATRPDFNTVDVRATQETHYDEHDYITWKGHPDLMWPGRELEFNSMTKYFYADRTVPKKKLTEGEMLEINRLYRIIGQCEQRLGRLGYAGPVP